MSDQEIKELRALVLSDRRSSRGPFSQEVRERVQGFLKEKWQSGEKLKHIGQQLGLSHHTVQYWSSHWSERDAVAPKMRRVEVVSERTTAREKKNSTVSMHGPAGTRIDGLSLEEVATLWRKLS
jgi:hypothetical protein